MAERASGWVGSDAERIVDVEDARAITSALAAHGSGVVARPGFIAGPDDPGLVTASGTPDTDVHVAAFQYVMPNSRGQFPYILTMDAPETIDVLVADPADPSNQRNDLIIAQQNDVFYGDGDSLMSVYRVVGTPAGSPVDPTPSGSPDYVPLARIRVTAGATAITSGMIDDLRPDDLTTARGGTIPCTSGTRPSDPYDGMVVYETDTGTIRVWSATAAAWGQVWTEVSGQTTTLNPVRIEATGGASPSTTSHGLQIGPSSGPNLRFDTNEVQAADNGSAADLNLNESGGTVVLGGALDVNGTGIFEDTVTLSPPVGSNSQAIALNHGWSVHADNVDIGGGAGTRLWINGPDNGDMVLGPRNGGEWLTELRLKTDLTTGSGANVFINSTTGAIARSTSSRRYKTNITDLSLDLAAVRAMRPVRYRDKQDGQAHVGFIAEEVHDLGLGEFVHYHEEDGQARPDGVQYDRLAVAQHLLIVDLEARLQALTERVAALEGA